MNIKNLLCIALLLVSQPLYATWYETTGSALVENGKKNLARELAVREAVKQALLFSGARVSSIQQVTNGLLTDDRFQVEAIGDVQSIELVNETYSDGKVYVTIRADISTTGRPCNAAHYNKAISVAQFNLVHRQHAVLGNLYDMGKQLSKRIGKHINQFSNSSKIVNKVYEDVRFPSSLFDSNDSMIRAITDAANMSDSQYLIFGLINDMSMGDNDSSFYKVWDTDKNRFIELEVFIFDGINGAMLYNETFDGQAKWEFAQTDRVNINSGKFWNSKYGRAVTDVVNRAASSIDAQLQCLPSQGKVIAVYENTIQFNLGTKHGVQKGDRLRVLQVASFEDETGHLRTKYNIATVELEVSKVYGASAVAQTVDDVMLSNVQKNDLVIKDTSIGIDADF